MDNAIFEPTPTTTRHEYIRKVLIDHFAAVLKEESTPRPVDDDKNLQGNQIVLNRENHRNVSLNGDESQDVSFWSPFAHPTRRFRRTNEFTKPDGEYFGNSQWRQM